MDIKEEAESIQDQGYDALSEILISDIKTLQEQQAELDVRLKLLTYQNDAHDLSFQMNLNKFYRR